MAAATTTFLACCGRGRGLLSWFVVLAEPVVVTKAACGSSADRYGMEQFLGPVERTVSGLVKGRGERYYRSYHNSTAVRPRVARALRRRSKARGFFRCCDTHQAVAERWCFQVDIRYK